MKGLLAMVLRAERGGIIGWGIGLGALVLLVVASFPAIEGQEDFDELWADYQDSLGSLFGDCPTLTSYECYMDTQIVAFLPVLTGIFAVVQASRMLAGQEETGRLDLILSTPVTRSQLIGAQLVTIAISQFIVSMTVGITIAFGALIFGETDLIAGSFLVGLNALPAGLFFGMLTYAASAFFHRRLGATLVGTFAVIASYFLGGLAPLSDTLDPMKYGSMTYLYQQSQPMRDGLDPVYFIVAVPLVALLALVAWQVFDRKDLTG